MKSIEERIEDFKKTLVPFEGLYGIDLLYGTDDRVGFFEYWTVITKNGKQFRKEKEKTWSLPLRLKTWKINNKNWYGRKPAITEREQRNESVGNLAELSRSILTSNRQDNGY
jgi:hypothetical protein